MHESLIGLLNRRFVTTWINTFPGPGADPAAKAWLDAHGIHPRYGAIVTPEGELVAAFGFRRDEFVAALRTAMRRHPERMRPTADELAILTTAAPGSRSMEAAGVPRRADRGGSECARCMSPPSGPSPSSRCSSG